MPRRCGGFPVRMRDVGLVPQAQRAALGRLRATLRFCVRRRLRRFLAMAGGGT
jgi:hypothetical protein